MGHLFKAKKQVKSNNSYYRRIQIQWVKKMQQLTYGLSKAKLLCLWAGFVIFSSGISLAFIYKGLSSTSSTIILEFISRPTTLHPLKDLPQNRHSLKKEAIENGIDDSTKGFVPRLSDSLYYIEKYKFNLKK